MDITPLYDLRERLRAGAVAGAGLAAEDFRLRRAVEAMVPLEKASPVFARIVQLSGQILKEDCEDRAGVLMDALTLTDAVLCTQAAVAAAGEPLPLPQEEAGYENSDTLVVNAPYSVLSVLLDALENSGGGRYGYVLEQHKEQPQLFRDYRVRAAMVKALGAAYAELAETVAEWLAEEGSQDPAAAGSILHLLQRGFDPKGKKDMIRRIQVMEAIAGGQANDFYLAQLPAAEKEMRGALIHALGYSPENEEVLLELANTEKGNNKKMACYVLARIGGEKTWEFFEKMAAKNPAQTASFLEGSKLEQAALLNARIFLEALEQWRRGEKKRDKELETLLDACLQAFAGKEGTKVCDCFRQAAALGQALDEPVETEKAGRWVMTFTRPGSVEKKYYFSQVIPEALFYSVLVNPEKELAALAGELYRQYGDAYFPGALAGALFTKAGEECQELLREFLEEKKLLGKKIRKDRAGLVQKVLERVKADPSGEGHVILVTFIDPADLKPRRISRSISTITAGMYDLLMELEENKTDMILASWIRPEDEDMCRRLAGYLYERALQVQDNIGYLEPLKRCHASDCSRLAVSFFTKNKTRVSSWQLASYLDRLPGSAESRAAEAARIVELLKKGELKGPGGCVQTAEEYIQRMKGEE